MSNYTDLDIEDMFNSIRDILSRLDDLEKQTSHIEFEISDLRDELRV